MVPAVEMEGTHVFVWMWKAFAGPPRGEREGLVCVWIWEAFGVSSKVGGGHTYMFVYEEKCYSSAPR